MPIELPNVHSGLELGFPRRSGADASAAPQQQIDWADLNWPPGCYLVHYGPSELRDDRRYRVARLQQLAYILLLGGLATNWLTSLVLVCSGLPGMWLKLVLSSLNLGIGVVVGAWLTMDLGFKGAAGRPPITPPEGVRPKPPALCRWFCPCCVFPRWSPLRWWMLLWGLVCCAMLVMMIINGGDANYNGWVRVADLAAWSPATPGAPPRPPSPHRPQPPNTPAFSISHRRHGQLGVARWLGDGDLLADRLHHRGPDLAGRHLHLGVGHLARVAAARRPRAGQRRALVLAQQGRQLAHQAWDQAEGQRGDGPDAPRPHPHRGFASFMMRERTPKP